MSREQGGGLSVTTLLIASGSAAAAAVIVPLFWDRGSLLAAAITPVIVTLTSEALKKPVEKVPTVGVWRRTPQGTAVRQPGGRDFEVHDPEEERLEVDPEQTDDPFGLREPERGSFFTRQPRRAGARHRRCWPSASPPSSSPPPSWRSSATRSRGSTARPSSAASPRTRRRRRRRPRRPRRRRSATPTADADRDADGDPDARRSSATPTPSVAPNAATPEPGATPAPTP